MTELRLRRDDSDKKRYLIEGVGELRLGKWYQRGGVISDTGGRSWELKSSAWKLSAEAVDEAGATGARYEPLGVLKRGGELELADGTLFELKPSSAWKNRYALWYGDTELASIETKGWTGSEVAVTLAEGASVAPLPLLMACWLVRRFGEDDAAAASGGGAAAGG